MLNKDIYNDDYYTDNQDYEYDEENEEEFKEGRPKSNSWSAIADKIAVIMRNHPFLSIKGEKDADDYEIEKNKFILLCHNFVVCKHYRKIGIRLKKINPDTYRFDRNMVDYGCDNEYADVIMYAVNRAISGFKSEQGYFDHYLNRFIGDDITLAKSNASISEKSHDMIPDKDKKLARNVFVHLNQWLEDNHYSKDRDKEIVLEKLDELVSYIGVATGKDEDRIKSIIINQYFTEFMDADAPRSDDDSNSVISYLEDPSQNIEEKIELQDYFKRYGMIVDEIIKGMQERSTPTIKAYVTNKICEEYRGNDEIIAILSQFDFWDKEYAEEIKLKIQVTKKGFSDKDIAEKFNVSGANIAGISTRFNKKLSEEMIKAGFITQREAKERQENASKKKSKR